MRTSTAIFPERLMIEASARGDLAVLTWLILKMHEVLALVLLAFMSAIKVFARWMWHEPRRHLQRTIQETNSRHLEYQSALASIFLSISFEVSRNRYVDIFTQAASAHAWAFAVLITGLIQFIVTSTTRRHARVFAAMIMLSQWSGLLTVFTIGGGYTFLHPFLTVVIFSTALSIWMLLRPSDGSATSRS